MANDYTLDPFQIQEDNLKEAYLRALKKTQVPTPDMADFSARFNVAADKQSGEQSISSIMDQRTALGQQVLQALPAALRAGSPESFTHPLTRDLAQARAKELMEMELDAQDRASRAAARNPMGPPTSGSVLPGSVSASGGGGTGLSEALDDINSIRPRVAKSGQERATLAMPRGNNASVGLNLNTGQFDVVPAGVQSAQQVDYAKSMNELTDWYNPETGRTEKRPRWFVEKAQGIGPPPGMPASSPGPGPSATLPPTSTAMPVSGPNMPVNGPPTGAGGSPSAPIPGNGPEPQQGRGIDKRAIFQNALAQEQQALEEAVASGDGNRARQVQSNIALVRAELAKLSPVASAQAQVPQVGPVDRGQFTVPQPGQGAANPQQAQLSQTSRESDYKDMLKYMEDTKGVFGARNTIDELERLNKKSLYSGVLTNTLARGGAELSMVTGNNPSQKYDDTQEYVAKSMGLIAPLATKLGYNPSNFDAQTAMKQIATTDNSPRARQQIIESMRRAVEYDIGTRDTIRQLMDQGMSLSQAQEVADGRYRRARDQKEAETRNPTQAGGEGKALPSAVAASEKPEEPGFWSKAVANFPKALGDSEQVARDMWGNLATLATGPFRSSHYAAGADSFNNMLEGHKQITGAGDPLAFEAERARQEKRMREDPGYAVSRGMTDVTLNPWSYVPGTGVLKAAAAAFGGGYSRPVGTEGGKGENAVFDTAFGLPLSVGAKMLPATRLAGDVNREGRGDYLLKTNPDLQITPNQANPDSFGATVGRSLGVDKAARKDQIAQLNKGIIAKAGMEGDLNPEKFAANEDRLSGVWNAIFPKGRVITATPADQAALADAIAKSAKVEDLTGKTSALARLYQAVKGKEPEVASAAVPAAKTVEAAKASSDNVVPGETAEEWAKRTGWKPQTKAQYTAAAEARGPGPTPSGSPGRHVGPLEKEAIQANQNHLDVLRAERDAEDQLMQDMIKGEFGHKGPIQRWKGTPEQEAKLKAALDGMDRSFSAETAKVSAAAEEAAKAERQANMAAADKSAQAYAAAEKPNLGPSDVPPHPTGKAKAKEPPKTFKFDAANLHEAWKDVGKVEGDPAAANEVRNLITGMIERHLDPGALTKFRQANNQWGITQDLKRLYSGGRGEGKGSSAGQISALSFERGSGEHPLSKETDEVGQAVQRFNIQDPTPEGVRSDTLWGAARDFAQNQAGKRLYDVSKYSQKMGDMRSSEGRKRMIELLRAAMERGYPISQSGSK